ncbi:hypothetical protein [Arthrobacter sp. A2-55]|uniref:hypothetical protein n=1 Tax=Arthrobacter sp. A2-55 TaxID=2897337 RepID=UPI0021CD9DAB|nr:hypothetical protein [Arthrobacter sp. A2-55]MCU6479090.1 hypothetical protein [Arthrobacter sp. A2-55]
MTTEGIARQPMGAPASTGGQFRSTVHAESPVRLFDREGGTFFNPSPAATAEYCIQFWSTVDVPDEIVEQLKAAYSQRANEEFSLELQRRMDEWRDAWLEANPKPRKGGKHLEAWGDQLETEYDAHKEAVAAEIKAERPQYLRYYDAPQLVRAAKMLYHRPNNDKFPDESIRVFDEPIELFDEVLTVEQIEQKYRLFELRNAMSTIHRDGEDRVLHALSTVSDQLHNINGQLIDQRPLEY